ncbi:hypothetical protein GGR57DRAFT_504172 [Xylariaceae sp. FL1272]|nr:hypothetical protein GGR57DRAFT_504172 [Xylariaceae sp. FL1272]
MVLTPATCGQQPTPHSLARAWRADERALEIGHSDNFFSSFIMYSLSNSPPSPPKGILKKPSNLSLRGRPRSKSAAIDNVARDIVTGKAVPQSPIPSSQYRAFHKGYRQEEGMALLLAKVDGMYDDVVRRLEVRVD